MERQLNAGQLQQHSLPWAAAAPPATEPPAINPATRGAGGKKAAASRPPVMYSMGVGTWPPSCACSRQAGRHPGAMHCQRFNQAASCTAGSEGQRLASSRQRTMRAVMGVPTIVATMPM